MLMLNKDILIFTCMSFFSVNPHYLEKDTLDLYQVQLYDNYFFLIFKNYSKTKIFNQLI